MSIYRKLYEFILNETWTDGRDRLLTLLFALAQRLNISPEEYEQQVREWLDKVYGDDEKNKGKRLATLKWQVNNLGKVKYSVIGIIRKHILEGSDINPEDLNKFKAKLEELGILEWVKNPKYNNLQ